jgi:hypothetical protein
MRMDVLFVHSVNAVILEQVGSILQRHQVVDRHNFKARRIHDNFQRSSSNTAEAIDCYFFHMIDRSVRLFFIATYIQRVNVTFSRYVPKIFLLQRPGCVVRL